MNLASQTICDHMLSDLKSDHTFHVFGYVLRFYFFFSYVSIIHKLKRWEGVEIYCNLIPDCIKSNPDRILFLTQYRIKFKTLLGKLSLKYHRVITQPDYIYLDYLVVTSYRVFSPKVFPRTYHQISQTFSTQITCWTHLFHDFISFNGIQYCVPYFDFTSKIHPLLVIFLLDLQFRFYV